MQTAGQSPISHLQKRASSAWRATGAGADSENLACGGSAHARASEMSDKVGSRIGAFSVHWDLHG